MYVILSKHNKNKKIKNSTFKYKYIKFIYYTLYKLVSLFNLM